MRDTETAEIAFRAAMTGHLVLSTLHSNDAPTSVTRLIDMGVPPFLVASGLVGMVAQRLVRRLCSDCRRQGPPTQRQATMLQISPSEKIWHPVGCPRCEGTGYKGRVGVHEVVSVDEAFARLIMDRAPGADLRKAAQQAGMIPIREDALYKIRMGITSADDVMRQVFLRTDDYEMNDTSAASLPPGMAPQAEAAPAMPALPPGM
jgi:type II secretory ATPase GspE/PulE/Tfp pilus assembly ATPase PilB-like protein